MSHGERVPCEPPLILATAVGLILAVLSLGCRSGLLESLPASDSTRYDEGTFASKSIPTFSIPAPSRLREVPPTTVIGNRRHLRVREGDTLLDIARYYDLGYNEIVEANPGVDPWQPAVGTRIVLPTEWILPCCRLDGIIINVPEMRLYFFRRESGSMNTISVMTHPVGLGRLDWRTPVGTFRVRGKTVNPQWNIPESIRRERIRETGDTRRSIPGGHVDNPLGKYRLELTLPTYAIHGTNLPWGIGRQVSHGCAQLYPEDIDRLFPLVDVGTPAEFTYQAVKVGTRDGEVYLEAHPDIYNYGLPTHAAILAALKRQGLDGGVDSDSISATLNESRGMPVRVSAVSGDHRAAWEGPDSFRRWRPVQ